MYDYVKGYHGSIDSLPKDIKRIVKARLLEDKTLTEDDVKELMLDVDVYIEVDIRNMYKK